MIPAPEICRSARLARDPRFDGRFFVGVVTTGIYCRPVCPARTPAEDNVRYFPTPATAQDAGFRACLRCRPETARRLPEWTLGSQSVIRALRLIDAGFLNDHRVEDLAARLQLSKRHLDRLFRDELATTPKSLAMLRRVQLAKRLIDRSPLALSEVALRAGFGSVRRFNDEMRTAFGRAPRELRRSADAAGRGDECLTLQLPLREPYNKDWVFTFLARRALPGIEEVQGFEYRRALNPQDPEPGWLRVSWQQGALKVAIPLALMGDLAALLSRLRRVFDLDADPEVIDARISADTRLQSVVAAHPGLRVPGAWDGFETTVRAVLGQQVSVDRATSLAQRLCAQFGQGAFPSPQQLAEADVAAIGMPGQRGAAIRELARAVASGDLLLDEAGDYQAVSDALCRIKGIGAWTAGYVGMRVTRDPDAFPDKDWVVLKALDNTAAAARRQAGAWRPWRAYGVMYLWKLADLQRQAGNWGK